MRTDTECVLYAGPSLAAIGRTDPLLTNVQVEAPIQRGQLPGLIARNPPGAIAIADGQFHQCLAVAHAEIRSALEAGWQVWGLSSMGAIRAFEMRSLGMRGYGAVYMRFCDAAARGEDFRDDEVALLHEWAPPYRAASEPLVHMRAALEQWTADGRISSEQARAVIAELQRSWYGERTMAAFADAVAARSPDARAWLPDEMRDFARFRTKAKDLSAFLRERPWRQSPG